MKIINPNRLILKVGDLIGFNQKAVDWMQPKNKGGDPWPSYVELQKYEPMKVIKTDWGVDEEVYYIIYIESNMGCTGLSHVVADKNVDMWFLDKCGRVLPNCPYPLFRKIS